MFYVNLRRVYEVILDLPIGEQDRSRRGFMTDILSRATGLASQDDLRGVQHILERIERGVVEASRLWGLSAAFKVEQERMRNVFDILGEYRQRIRALQYHFVDGGHSYRHVH